ncbi:hypothetical protein F8M49_30075 [Rhodococcus zopfii]|uniref:Uncharacterized protein n=1 Tax=Rhodococcus zopfii TaxID=43772 RepID=A0ABU3WJS6_9NOCA|nr:hypothetical protein [Rhodococcus zopfii]MDV2478608.1 hypothetical protein [Rhodococcus zopfii]
MPNAPADVSAEPADNAAVQQHADPAPVQRPKQTASKPAWVEYAVYRGIDRDEAEATEKRDLIAAIDALN